MTSLSLSDGSPVEQGGSPSPRAKSMPQRQRRPHTRSKTGCLVCRQRHKRCDENYVEGSCQRCRRSGIECEPPPQRRRKHNPQTTCLPVSQPGNVVEDVNIDQPSQTTFSPPSILPLPQPDLDPFFNNLLFSPQQPTGSNTMYQPLDMLNANSTSNGVHNSNQNNHHNSSHVHNTAGPMLSHGSYNADLGLDLVLPDLAGGDTAVSSEQMAAFLESLCNTTGEGSTPWNFGQGDQASGLDFPSINIDPNADTGQPGCSSLWFDAALSTSALLTNPSEPETTAVQPEMEAESSTAAIHQPDGGPSIFDPDLDALNRLVQMDSSHHKSGQAAGRGLPQKLSNGGSVWDDASKHVSPFTWTRVAADYSKYQASWRSEPAIDRQKSQASSEPGVSNPLQSTTRAAVLEAVRLRADHFTSNSGKTSENMGSVFSDFAMTLLGNPESLSLSESMSAISDLQTYNFLVAGGAASYGALRIGETIVRIFLGDALELDLADESHRTASLVVFAQADLGRCLCSLGDLPLFRLKRRRPDEIQLQKSLLPPDQQYCVPLAIHQVLHEICLASNDPMKADRVKGIAESLEQVVSQDPTARRWRLCATILLYQRLAGASALHPTVRSAGLEILLNMPPRPCQKYEVFCLFVAGTTAFLPTQRQAVNLRWVSAPERGFEEAGQFLDLLWSEMDRKGVPIDWVTFAHEKGITLAFF